MPFDDAISYMQRMAQDSSSATLTFLKMMYNIGYKIILTEFGRQVTESDSTIDLVATQRSYQVAADCMMPKSVEVIDGTTIDPLIEVDNEQMWAAMRSGAQQGKPTHFFYRPRFGVGAGVIELNPIPSSSDYDMRVVYETRDKDLSVTKYDTGTIALTNDDATVTGSGVTFTAGMVGRYLIPTSIDTENLPFRIVEYTDATHLELENNYPGTTGSGKSYKIVEIPNLPEDMQIIPCYFALEAHWSSKGNGDKQKEFKDNWVIGMARAKKTHSVKTRNQMIQGSGIESPFPTIPSHFPLSLVE